MAKTCDKYKLYLITNLVTGGQYVGVTSTSISHRWRQHRFDARNGKKYRLHNAIRKYGEDKFAIEHIASAASEVDLLAAEKLLIEQYGTFGRGGGKGYNLTIGGEGTQGAGVERVVAGKVFPSLTDACDYYGLDRSRVSQRLSSRGWTIEQALDLEPPPMHKPSQAEMIEVGGAVFESLQAAVDAYHLNYETVRHRMLRDWSKEQAFGLAKPPPLLPTTGKQIVVDGVVYESKAEAAKQLGVIVDVASARLKAGWSAEQSFGVEPPPPRQLKKGKEIVVGDMVFRSISAATRYFGIPIGTVSGRLQKECLTLEQVFGLDGFQTLTGKTKRLPVKGHAVKGHAITVEGKEYMSNAAAARAHGVSASKLHSRMNALGWTLEQSLGVAPPPKRIVNVNGGVSIDGKKFASLREASRFYGVPYERALQRVKKLGWSLEQAFEAEPIPKRKDNRDYKGITVAGVYYGSIKEAAEAFGVNYANALHRLRNAGWTPEEAFEAVPRANITGKVYRQ